MDCGWGRGRVADLDCCMFLGTVDGSEPGPFSFQHLSCGDAGGSCEIRCRSGSEKGGFDLRG
jgi:hypothetical protein